MTLLARKPKRDRAFSMALAGVSVFALLMAFRIETLGTAAPHDPGPRALPWFISAILIVGALYEFFAGKPEKAPQSDAPRGTAVVSEFDRDFRTAAILLGAMIVYLIAVPWLGFFFCTLIFSTAMMRLLGASWKLSGAASAAILLTVYVLFVKLFLVQLPSGVTGVLF